MDSYSFKIEAVSKEHAAFVTLRKLVSETYWENYNATINPEPDYFVAARDNESNWLGCFGVTLAEHRPLFSERYLGHPVEALLQDMLGVLPMRSVIAECGAFASPKLPGIGKILVGAMPWILASFGMRRIEEAHDCNEAVGIVASGDIDIAFVDFKLGGQDGIGQWGV